MFSAAGKPSYCRASTATDCRFSAALFWCHRQPHAAKSGVYGFPLRLSHAHAYHHNQFSLPENLFQVRIYLAQFSAGIIILGEAHRRSRIVRARPDIWWTVQESNLDQAVMSCPPGLRANGPYSPLRAIVQGYGCPAGRWRIARYYRLGAGRKEEGKRKI